MILLKNGFVVDPGSGFQQISDILIEDERISRIEREIDISALDKDLKVVDCSGCIVGPGLVDVHVHFRDPGFEYKEDILSGAKAAARGGVTSLVLMANTRPVIDNEESLKYVIEKGLKTDVHIYTCASITKGLKGQELVDMEDLINKGAVGFTDDGIPILSEEIVLEAMKKSAELGAVLSFHEEDPKYIGNNGINMGKASEYFDVAGSNRMAEISMVKRDIELAMQTGAIVNFQHISCRESVELIREAKKDARAINIHCEATPHHMSMTEKDTIKYGSNAKMNPPLREEEDRDAVIEGIVDGTIDLIATDHAPHSEEEKSKKITDAPSGIIGLETSLATAYNTLVKSGKIDVLQLFCKLSYNPAKLYKLDAGEVAIDRLADIVIFDPNMIHLYDKTLSKSFNSPLKNKKITGDIVMTISSGKVVYQQEG